MRPREQSAPRRPDHNRHTDDIHGIPGECTVRTRPAEIRLDWDESDRPNPSEPNDNRLEDASPQCVRYATAHLRYLTHELTEWRELIRASPYQLSCETSRCIGTRLRRFVGCVPNVQAFLSARK